MGWKSIVIRDLVDQAARGNRRAIERLERIAEDYWFKVEGLPIKKWLKKTRVHFHLLNTAKCGDV